MVFCDYTYCVRDNPNGDNEMAKAGRRAAPKRTRLNREKVLRAALRMADKGGIETLSMRKLAQELGVEAMSLYNHVKNKDDIIDGIVDMVAGEIELPAIGADWKSAMRRRAMSAHEVLLRHPWATMPLVSRVNIGPSMLRYVDATIGCLREAGFSFELADHVWNAVDSHVYGFTLQELNFPFDPDEYAEAAKAFLPMLPADKYPYLHGLSSVVIAREYDGLHSFEFGLDLLLDGLEKLKSEA